MVFAWKRKDNKLFVFSTIFSFSGRLWTALEGVLAERVGFEPTLEFPLNTLSKRAPSTTRPSLHVFNYLHHYIPIKRLALCGKELYDALRPFYQRTNVFVQWFAHLDSALRTRCKRNFSRGPGKSSNVYKVCAAKSVPRTVCSAMFPLSSGCRRIIHCVQSGG